MSLRRIRALLRQPVGFYVKKKAKIGLSLFQGQIQEAAHRFWVSRFSKSKTVEEPFKRVAIFNFGSADEGELLTLMDLGKEV